MISMAELIADRFAQGIDPRRVTPTQNMVLNGLKAEAIKRAAREFLRRKREKSK